ncbi:hypothetical protein EB796_002156 [Bugula neritina]|uniref:Metalloendopeptidase n=1 Tax=Bugula neritina TaxID=10212 RepID=A0A7J7KMZ2_BUGNE|nr:hypothetical protein EB796_002156 [Bugula neritina]
MWPHGIVPYYIDLDTYTTGYSRWSIKQAVSAGLQYLQSVSCIKFIELSKLDSVTLALIGHRHAVRVYNGPGCWSHSGCSGCHLRRNRNTTQTLSLSSSCANDEIVQHEFGHVLGVTHEHTRTDSHLHIGVNYSLVSDPTAFYRKIHPEFVNFAPYDLSSIQHYQTPAIVTRRPEDAWLKAGMGKLTHYDEWNINSAYCSAGCDRSYCMNDGYVTGSGGRCRCKCPEGLTGSRCETTTTGNQYGCGGVVYLTGHTPSYFLRTPNYPSNYKSRLRCVWLVKAPRGKIIHSSIEYMDIPATSSGCKHSVEIRDRLVGQVARENCGNAILTVSPLKAHQILLSLF